MTDYSELKRLAEALNRAIAQAEHKPGEWAETAQSMGSICCPGEPFQIGKPWVKEEPWASFSYKRDSWLAVAAVNALPQLLALIAENDRLKTLRSTTERDLAQELEVWKHGPSCWNCGDTGDVHDMVGEWRGQCDCNAAKLIDVSSERDQLKAENEALRKDAERYRWLRDSCGLVEYKVIAGSIGAGMLPSGEKLESAIDVAMGKGALHD